MISSRQFDRKACPIPEALEKSVDIVHLLMCEVAAAACRHAGWDPFHLPLRNTGVFIGHAQGSNLGGDYTYATCVEEAAQFLHEVDDFQSLPPDQQQAVIDQLIAEVRGKLPRRGPDTPDVAASMVAGTISKAFGLTGPFLAINSACASSLQAMLVAARALQSGPHRHGDRRRRFRLQGRFADLVLPCPGASAPPARGLSTPMPTA